MTLSNLRSFAGESELDKPEPLADRGARVRVFFGADYIRPLFVIVEMYDRKNFGRGRRAWNKEFTPEEKKVISRYYGLLYDCYLRRGIPVNGLEMMPSTLQLLQRAANFFASLT